MRWCGGALAVALCFLTALFWAKARDPFRRIEFCLKTESGAKVKYMALLRKPIGKYPVVVYLHGLGGSLVGSGTELRQMAELGFAAVGVEYDQTNQAVFAEQFAAVCANLKHQSWAQSNATAWVGFSMGAQKMLSFALRHPENQPQLLVRLGGGWVEELGRSEVRAQEQEARAESLDAPRSSLLGCPVLIVHGGNDEVFPVKDCERVAEALRTNATLSWICIFPNQPHDFGEEHAVILRLVGEYCVDFFGLVIPRNVNVRGSYWYYWIPMLVVIPLVLMIGWCHGGRQRFAAIGPKVSGDPLSEKPGLLLRGSLGPSRLCVKGSRALSIAVWPLCCAAVSLTAMHLVLPRMEVTDGSLKTARKFLIGQPALSDVDYLARKPIWKGQTLRMLLQHLELAHLQRDCFYENLPDCFYRAFVLSPEIDSGSLREQGWRRILWENFFPHVRKEKDPRVAAEILVRRLRERISLNPGHSGSQGGPRKAQMKQGLSVSMWQHCALLEWRPGWAGATMRSCGTERPGKRRRSQFG